MARFRIVRGGVDDSHPARTNPDDSADPALTRRLRGMYAAPPPSEGYWDGLEATIMAAVRAGRSAATIEWWHLLARWARPGLAAAAVMLGVTGGVLLQTNGARSNTHAIERAAGIEPLDEDLARVIDTWGDSLTRQERDEARLAAELLTDGVKRRPAVRLDLEPATPPDTARSRREATFRAVVP